MAKIKAKKFVFRVRPWGRKRRNGKKEKGDLKVSHSLRVDKSDGARFLFFLFSIFERKKRREKIIWRY